LLLRCAFELRIALWAALALLSTSAWRFAAAVASPGAIVTAAWLLVLVPYVASQAANPQLRRKRLCFAGLSALATGIGLSLSWSVFWALPFMALHYLLVERRSVRAFARRGALPAPAAFVLSVGLLPLLLVLLNPAHWGASATAMARVWLTPLHAPEVVERDVLGFLVKSGAAFLLLVGAAGCPLMLFERLTARFADFRVEQAHLYRVVAICIVLGIVCAVLGPLLVPAVLASKHTHFELMLPFFAASAAVVVISAARRVQAGRFAPIIEASSLVVVLSLG
jgi:hypothetical protein